MPEKAKQQHNTLMILGVMLVFGALLYFVLRPYLMMVLLALVVVILFEPLYAWLLRVTGKRRSIASLLATILVFICILIPVVSVIAVAANQAVSFALHLNRSISRGDIRFDQLIATAQGILGRLPGNLKFSDVFNQNDVIDQLKGLTTTLGQFASTGVLAILQNSVAMVTNLTIFFFVLTYMFQDKEKLLSRLTDLSPLAREQNQLLLDRFKTTTRALVKGNFVIAFVQGVLGGVMFFALGISAPVFWAVMMMIGSLIPLGSGIIWIPAAIILLISGAWFKGILLLFYGNLVISTIDNVIRSKLMEGGQSHIPPLLTLLSVLGGIQLFGFMGFLYGPLVGMLFLTSMRLYLEARNHAKTKTAAKGEK